METEKNRIINWIKNNQNKDIVFMAVELGFSLIHTAAKFELKRDNIIASYDNGKRLKLI